MHDFLKFIQKYANNGFTSNFNRKKKINYCKLLIHLLWIKLLNYKTSSLSSGRTLSYQMSMQFIQRLSEDLV